MNFWNFFKKRKKKPSADVPPPEVPSPVQESNRVSQLNYGSNNTQINQFYEADKKDAVKELTDVPTRNPDTLIGREGFLDALRKNLEEQQEVVLVNAMGGVGKTSVAEAYTSKYYHAYERIVWLQQTEEEEDFRWVFVSNQRLLRSLEINAEGKKIDDLFVEVCHRLNQITAQPKLIVLDNINSEIYSHWQALPKPPNWHVLLTSREKIPDIYVMRLAFLEKADALEVFQFYLGKQIEEKTKLMAILNRFDRHTLTIEILAKAKRKYRYTLEELSQALPHDLEVAEVTSHSKKKKIARVKSYLVRMFTMSKLTDTEIWLLKQFACLPSTLHTFQALAELLTNDQFDQKKLAHYCNELHDKGWLLYNDKEDAYKMHAIIREVLPAQYPIKEIDIESLIVHIIGRLEIDQTKDNPVDKFPFIPFGQSILDHVQTDTTLMAKLQNNLALVLQALGDYTGARELLEKAMRSDERNFGMDHPTTAVRYSNLGSVLQALGDYTGARELLEKAMRSAERNFGMDHPTTAVSYSNLALVLQALGDYTGARELLEKAMRSDERNFGMDHPTTAVRYSNLALVLKALGDYTGARELLEKAMRSDERNFGMDHPTTAVRYSNLALVLKALGDYTGARELLEKAMRSAERNFGMDHPTTAVSYSNLGSVLQALGDYTGARELLEKAMRSAERNFGMDHPTTAVSYSNLALVLQALGDYTGARELLEKAMRSDERNFGMDHPTTAGRYSNLALVLQDLGDYTGARELLEKAMRSDERNFGMDHPTTAVSYSNLASVLQDLGDYTGARELLEKAMRSDERNFGMDHPTTAVSYSNLALVLQALGDYTGARELLEKAMRSDERNFGMDHPTTAVSYSNLGSVFFEIENHKEALKYFEKASMVLHQALPKGHPNIQTVDNWVQAAKEKMKK